MITTMITFIMQAIRKPCAHSLHTYVIKCLHKLVRIQLGTYMYIVFPAYCFNIGKQF